MRILTKNICLGFLTLLCAACFILFATAFFSKNAAKADSAALETEFTNNGQFAVGNTAWGGTHTFIDGTAIGGTGAVLQTTNIAAGTAGFRLNFTDTGLRASSVESITVRVKVENFTLGTDEFRTSKLSGSDFVNYGKTDDLSDWFDYTLNAKTMAQLTNEDGTLGYTDIVIRAYTAGLILYVDSVTIVEKVDYEALFTNDGEFAVGKTDWNSAYEFIDGTAVGGTGAVLKATVLAGVAGFKLDFTGKNLLASKVESIVVRVKADNFVQNTDYFKTALNTGNNYHDYLGDDLSDWFDYTLDATSMAQLTNNDGTLGSVDIVIRAKSSNNVIAYFDSVTIVEKVDYEVLFTNDQFTVGTTNWGFTTYEFIDGTSVGGEGAVLQANTVAGVAGFKLDFTGKNILASSIDSIKIKLKATNFVLGTDFFRTALDTSSSFVDYGKADDLNNWFEYTLNAATMAQLTNNDGTLGSVDIVVRSYAAGVTVYFDSVTITEKLDYAADFTHDGQFAVKASDWNDEYEYINGTSVGGTGAVLKVTRSTGTGTAGFKLDFTGTGLRAKQIESIVVRVKAENAVIGQDYFRTALNNGTNFHDYSKSDDLNTWQEYTLDATSMGQLPNEDGTLGSIDIAVRTKTAGVIAYFDSVTVTIVESLESEFTNNWQFEVKKTDWNSNYEFIDGTSVGGTGAVLKAVVLSGAGVAGFKLDLSNSGLRRVDVESIKVRVKADNFVTGTDYFKTAINNGQNFHDYTGDDLSDWFEYTLDSVSMTQLTNEDGTLGSIDLVIRAKSSNDVIVYFDSVTITIDESAPKEPTVVCQGIANDENNNIDERNGKYRTLLRYDKDLGSAANSNEVVLTTGLGIKLNGVSLAVIQGASINYGHGKGFIQIRIPKDYQDNLVATADEVILEVIAGTEFESQVLDYAKFELIGGQWVTYQEPEPIAFATIFWNNAGGDVYVGKNGVLLSYSQYLSAVPNQVNGGMKEENLVGDEIGEKIKLDGVALANIPGAEIMYFGTSLLWIYVPNMDTYKELTIESTEFLMVILPETHLAFFDGEWAESIKITHTINGVEMVTYGKKNGKTVLGAKYYADLFADEDLAVKLVSFKVGNTIYNSKHTLTVNTDMAVTATVVGFETTEGAYIRIYNPTGIRFETKVDKANYDYLVSVYGEDNVEAGTYIVPKTYLGMTAFGDYFTDNLKTEGVDYVKIVNQGFINEQTAETDGYYKYYGSLVNILAHNFTTDFFGIGYIKITQGDHEFVLYGGKELDNYTRSIFDVSKIAYNDFELGTNGKTVIKGYLDGVVSIVSGASGIQIENVTEGYVSPYSITYNSISGEYTVTGAEIKSMLINGAQVSSGANLININDAVYKLTGITMSSSSTIKCKLTPITPASDLVDFVLEMPTDREMRILQLTDTQIIDSSQKRSETPLGEEMIEWWRPYNIDKNCFNYISALIESEQPDLILLTGDIIYGRFDDSGEIWTRIVDFMDSFGIPWAPIFGNHDNESAKGVDWQCAQLEAAQNCLFKRGSLTGNGNYSVGLIDASGKIRRVIYMLDSNGCVDSNYNLIKAADIYPDQINWFKSVSAAIEAAYGEKVPAFMCYHIPSLDFQAAYVNKYGYAATGQNFNLDVTGVDGDFGQKNEDLNMFGTSIASDMKSANVDAVFSGHDHVNNFSIVYDGIRYTYGTKTGIYDYYNSSVLGGTLIRTTADGTFEISHRYLNKQEMANRTSASLTITLMSDMHFDEKDYGDFHCLQADAKLRQIVSETPGSRFYINLGDTVNSLDGKLNNMYDAVSLMKELGLNVYNSEGTGYVEDNRMMYNLCGNHEAAYYYKSELKDYIPYVEDVGTVGVFKYEDLMFVMVDALFDSNGADDPATVFKTKFFTIPDVVINWLEAEVTSQMDGTVKGIVLLNHVALQDIDDSKYTLLNAIKGYGLPMTIFDGHTHAEAYHELTDEITGEIYCEEYTLPAVVVGDNYKYYNVTFKDGKVINIDKHNDSILNVN